MSRIGSWVNVVIEGLSDPAIPSEWVSYFHHCGWMDHSIGFAGIEMSSGVHECDFEIIRFMGVQ